MPRPLIITVQGSRNNSQPLNADLDIETTEPPHVENHHDEKQSKRKSRKRHSSRTEKERSSRSRNHKKGSITRSKSVADLKREQKVNIEEDNSRLYQRRHSSTQDTESKMFNFREMVTKFETLSTEPHEKNSERDSQTLKPRTLGVTSAEKESKDLREIDQIKARARILIQDARRMKRSDDRYYLQWQNEVLQLLKKIGDVDNKQSKTVQQEKQITLRIFRESYKTTDVKTNGNVENSHQPKQTETIEKVTHEEIDPSIQKVALLRNLYESKQANVETNHIIEHVDISREGQRSGYRSTSSTSSSNSSDSLSSNEDVETPQTYQVDAPIERVPFERNVDEVHIAKVQDLKGVFEKESHQVIRVSTKLPSHIEAKPINWYEKVEQEVVLEDSGVIQENGNDTALTIEDPQTHKEETNAVSVRDLKSLFESNNPTIHVNDSHLSTLQFKYDEKYVQYEENLNEEHQAFITTDISESASKDLNEGETESVKVADSEEAEDLGNGTQELIQVEQIGLEVISEQKYQPFVEVEQAEGVVISEINPNENKDEHNDAKEEVKFPDQDEPQESVSNKNETEDMDDNFDEVGSRYEIFIKPGVLDEELSILDEEVKHDVTVKELADPELEKVLVSWKVLDEINSDIAKYAKDIDEADVEDANKRMFLNEMLLRSVIQLENLETYQNEELLKARKESLLFVKESINKLKKLLDEEAQQD